MVLCKNDENIWKWFSQYIAQMFQHPDEKTNTVIVFKGLQGCGKNLIIDMIANGIIGEEYAVSTANPERVFFGTFNSLLGNKLLAVCNEAGNGLRECMDKMKDIATSPTINVEKKCKDPIVFNNYVNIMATTNNLNPLDISIDDRRMVWIECDNKFVGNEEYFAPLVKICNSDEGVSSFYHYFKEEVKITIQNFQIERPITKEYMKLQKMNTPNPIKFLLEYTGLDYKLYKKEENAVVKRSMMYKSYVDYCTKYRFTPFNKDGFESRIVVDNSGITLCTFHGNQCYRFNKKVYEAWIGKYKKLDGDVEDITFDDECDNVKEIKFIEENEFDDENENSIV
jgi:phage/plasmid-associated DNA primase